MNQNVLACIDGSIHTGTVCDYAAWATQKLDGRLVLLHVVQKPEPTVLFNISGAATISSQDNINAELRKLDEKREALAKEQSKQFLEQAKAHVIAAGFPSPRTIQREGKLLNELEQFDDYSELLVIGRQGASQGDSDNRVGTHVEQVIRTTDKPLLLTVGEFTEPKKLMLAFDGSETARKAVTTIANAMLFKGMECHLVMVAGPDPQYLEQLEVARLELEEAGLNAVSALLQGKVKENLLAYQEKQDIDLIIMGAYGHSRIRQWLLGSITNLMLKESPKPLLILR